MKRLLSAALLALALSPAHAAKPPAHKATHRAAPTFASEPAVREFVQDLAQRQGFSAETLLAQFGRIHPNEKVLKLIAPPASPTQRSWERYRGRFLTEQRIDGGVQFFNDHQVTLARASALYGVPPEIIVAIIGVETIYGRHKGGFGVMEALSTLAFHYPRRAEFFRTELEQFLLLARENDFDPLAIKGSFAGAIGIPQFMPGSQRRYGVDFDGDQRVDLAGSTEDAIGSVARFMEQHGWQSGQPVAVPALTAEEPDPALIEAGIRPTLRVGDLAAKGLRAEANPDAKVALIDLTTPGAPTEYWLGFENFYVITRYNRSNFYAMAVYQLAESIRQRLTP